MRLHNCLGMMTRRWPILLIALLLATTAGCASRSTPRAASNDYVAAMARVDEDTYGKFPYGLAPPVYQAP